VRLKRAVSPHLAAKLSGKQITIEQVYRTLMAHFDQKVSWIVEGAGGALVPLNESEQMVSSPVVDQGEIYFGSTDGFLYSLK